MQRWHASKSKKVVIEIWLEDQAAGWIKLYKIDGLNVTVVAANDSVAESLKKSLPPENTQREFQVRVINSSYDQQPKPVLITVSQDGVILPADDGNVPINGTGPYHAVQFSDPADWNLPTYHYFWIWFS